MTDATATEREVRLLGWLRAAVGRADVSVTLASADASFRRYLRVRHGGGSFIVMDAPPGFEDCRPFVDVAGRLLAAGLHAPRVHAADLDAGFLLLDDLGDRSYLDVLRAAPAQAGNLYRDAFDALAVMQAEVETAGLPVYDEALLRRELELFPVWYLERHLGVAVDGATRALLDHAFSVLVARCLEQPQVFVHRDYHSRNLMWGEQRNPGIIDFQDAVLGPVTYDAVSLMRDVYIEWPRGQVLEWLRVHHARSARVYAGVAFPDLVRWFDATAAQRLIKVAGIFARLFHRDGKTRYLADIPLTLRHLREALAGCDGLEPLAAFVGDLDVRAGATGPPG